MRPDLTAASQPRWHGRAQCGFSLIELAIALGIAGLLAGGLLLAMGAQLDQQNRQLAARQFDDLRDSLLGFLLSQGRLPCPADPSLADSAPAAGQEDCSRQHGIVPWVTLGLPAADPWGRRLTYYASERFTGAPATPGGAAFTLDTVGNANVLDVNGKTVASALPLVVVSHGPNGLGGWLGNGSRMSGASGSEAENADADLTFVAETPGSAGSDDLLLWISSDQLKARLAAAGRLP